MGALLLIAVGTALGSVLAVIATHYLRIALKHWLKKS